MPELQRLRADHAPAVLAFELANRAYFATFISDRGDEFFDQFTERYNGLLAEQEAGICIFHVLVGEDGTVLGRFNLYDLKDGTAELGYRVAQHAKQQFLLRANHRLNQDAFHASSNCGDEPLHQSIVALADRVRPRDSKQQSARRSAVWQQRRLHLQRHRPLECARCENCFFARAG